MNTLHQKNRDGERMETLCGLVLDQDIRDRTDMMLATLALDQADIDLNFGSDAVICEACQGTAVEQGEEEPDDEDTALDCQIYQFPTGA